ncbi:sensor histidine kinase [Paractinoplanes atraurantiacus]|uniref:histidine kinase n=1 Tax=Paractinoplanes atraurantiacus TaxID=1036182 RepID=A0A285JB75_9ACTN|nr:histidine kinase [Actinoplanes atraurantiacus]SNY57485.1 Signal transduction histidine kinase [Actinoplanes atraurantiacus]
MRRWLVELTLAAVAVALGVFFTVNSLGEGDGWPVRAEAVAGAIAVAGLILFRRSRPAALTLALIPFGIFFAMPMGALPIALFSVALHRRGPIAIALAALHAVALAVVYGFALGLTRVFYESVTFIVLLNVSLVAIGMLIRSHRQLVASWAERARQAEEGQRLRVEQARLAERERIAREMHDVLAHRISLLAVHAGALEVRRDASPEEQKAAGTIRQSAHDALEDLRTVIGMLRTPGEDRPQPTLGDVPALVEQSREAGAEVGLIFDGADGVPEQVGRSAYRIVQEALTNARKHAPGAPIEVTISRTADPGLTVEVGNALAAGGSRLPGAGAGLTGLRERVHLIGGRLEHGPTPGGEFQLKAWLPWPT